VLAVTSAAAGLDSLKTFQPPVLISDIGMPQMDGLALIQAIRSLPPEQLGRVPAIALTAYTRDVDQQRALASGFQKHLSKPIDIEKLMESIRALLADSKQ
jgi:CheY-like chemotaxis protein